MAGSDADWNLHPLLGGNSLQHILERSYTNVHLEDFCFKFPTLSTSLLSLPIGLIIVYLLCEPTHALCRFLKLFIVV